ncbi:Ubiquitin-like modifier-activating enzyme atg7 [Smittium mucronatum]|uniref:Ubiquitin-like modifier-activating enzyme atg7 n=1 Tax=Smittium mucronatum TaxID=133383 RepID=A0A1R0H8F6_9FUNG|nr:Ubiquitin-like modifier-activating enzyme atg7 [Smittium mucronatum]
MAQLSASYRKFSKENPNNSKFFIAGYISTQKSNNPWKLEPLTMLNEMKKDYDKVMVFMLDPCGQSNVCGWPLRNLLVWFRLNCTSGYEKTSFVCFKDPSSSLLDSSSDNSDDLEFIFQSEVYEILATKITDLEFKSESEGILLNIPMPGHFVPPEAEKEVLETCQRIHELVESHDVVFCLTDSRESRWLPTLLGAFCNKLVICSALGFDSFVVMRHGRPIAHKGVNGSVDGENKSGKRLGCYFCNDVVAPIDVIEAYSNRAETNFLLNVFNNNSEKKDALGSSSSGVATAKVLGSGGDEDFSSFNYLEELTGLAELHRQAAMAIQEMELIESFSDEDFGDEIIL